MKVAYLLEICLKTQQGVLSKLNAQVAQWEKEHNEVKVFVIAHSKVDDSVLPKNHVCFSILKKPTKSKILKYINRIISICFLKYHLNKYKPNIVYYRQNIYFPGLLGALSVNKVIMEINSNDVEESRHFSCMVRNFYLWGRERIIKKVSGFVCVSDEIAAVYKNYNKVSVVIPNGIVLSENNILCSSYDFIRRPNLIFVGTQEGKVWHGLDKIYVMARALPEFDFHIVGYEIGKVCNLSNVIQYGMVPKKDLSNIYKNMDVGIGSLALYKNKMQQASPLKVREYLSCGLPVIIGYFDSDFPNNVPFVLRLPNTEDGVINNVDKIRNFVNTWLGKRVKLDNILHLDVSVKEKQRLEFMGSFL